MFDLPPSCVAPAGARPHVGTQNSIYFTVDEGNGWLNPSRLLFILLIPTRSNTEVAAR